MTLYIKAESYAGSDIQTVSAEMCRLAKTLKVGVQLSFNGKNIHAYPWSTTEQVAMEYTSWLESKSKKGVFGPVSPL